MTTSSTTAVATQTQTIVQPYLDFEGRTEEALRYYEKAVGAKIDCILRYSESPEPCPEGMIPAGSENKVMHSQFRIGESVVMASDCYCSGKPTFAGVTLSLAVPTVEDADRVFAALAAEGQVIMPLEKSFFAEKFGMLIDRFGVNWMVITGAMSCQQ